MEDMIRTYRQLTQLIQQKGFSLLVENESVIPFMKDYGETNIRMIVDSTWISNCGILYIRRKKSFDGYHDKAVIHFNGKHAVTLDNIIEWEVNPNGKKAAY